MASVWTKENQLLLIVNPIGGGGTASTILNELVLPMLDAVKATYTVRATSAAGHASEIVRDLPVGEYGAVVCVSGDGMLNEMLNGAYSRSDVDEFLAKTTFGIIPAGTANGMAASMHVETVPSSVEAILKNRFKPVDVMKVILARQPRPLYGFMSLSWGFVADHDFLTETKYRWMGPALSTSLAPVVTWFARNPVRGGLKLQPVDSNAMPVTTTNGDPILRDEANPDMFVIPGPFLNVSVCNANKISQAALIAPHAMVDDNQLDVVVLYNCSMYQYLQFLLGIEHGIHVDNPNAQYFKAKQVILQPQPEVPIVSDVGCLDLDGFLVPGVHSTVDLLPKAVNFFHG